MLPSTLVLFVLALLCGVSHAKTVETTLKITKFIGDPDGFAKQHYFINGELMGPTIWADVGDEIVVHVQNHCTQEEVTIHFHGMHQWGTQWHDGAHLVNACGIPPEGGEYTYRFIAENPGTHWYHSHVTFQIEDGISGALIVRETDPAKDAYMVPKENEVVVKVTDWLHYSGALHAEYAYFYYQQLGGFPKPGEVNTSYIPYPRAMLLNGKGTYDCSEEVQKGEVNNKNSWNSQTCYWRKDKLPTFEFNKDELYRLRFIDSGGTSFNIMEVCLSHGTMTIIALDGNFVTPKETQCFTFNAGQRVDAMWNATLPAGQPSIWLRAKTHTLTQDIVGLGAMYVKESGTLTGSCWNHCGGTATPRSGGPECSCEPGCETGAIKCCEDYTAVCNDVPPVMDPSFKPTDSGIPVTHQEDIEGLPLKEKLPDPTYTHDFHSRGYIDFSARTMNQSVHGHGVHIHGDIPTPLQYRWWMGETDFPDWVFAIPKDAVVQWVFNNQNTTRHPIHLHGHSYYVLGSGEGYFDPEKDQGKLNLVNPQLRDTYDLRGKSWLVVRFRAYNPGSWVVHCHMANHVYQGMNFVINVGEPNDISPPPHGWPTCLNPDSPYALDHTFDKVEHAEQAQRPLFGLIIALASICVVEALLLCKCRTTNAKLLSKTKLLSTSDGESDDIDEPSVFDEAAGRGEEGTDFLKESEVSSGNPGNTMAFSSFVANIKKSLPAIFCFCLAISGQTSMPLLMGWSTIPGIGFPFLPEVAVLCVCIVVIAISLINIIFRMPSALRDFADWHDWARDMPVGFFFASIYMSAFKALGSVDATVFQLFKSTSLVLTAVLSVFFLGARYTTVQWLGAISLLLCVIAFKSGASGGGGKSSETAGLIASIVYACTLSANQIYAKKLLSQARVSKHTGLVASFMFLSRVYCFCFVFVLIFLLCEGDKMDIVHEKGFFVGFEHGKVVAVILILAEACFEFVICVKVMGPVWYGLIAAFAIVPIYSLDILAFGKEASLASVALCMAVVCSFIIYQIGGMPRKENTTEPDHAAANINAVALERPNSSLPRGISAAYTGVRTKEINRSGLHRITSMDDPDLGIELRSSA